MDLELATPPQQPQSQTSDRPRRTKHAELTEILRDLVTTLQPGNRLPAQEELMRRYQVSDRTVLRSLEDLQREGWIVRRPGSGTYVTDPRERVNQSQPQANLSATAQSLSITAIAPHFFAASYLRYCANLLSTRVEASGLSLVCHPVRYESSVEEILQSGPPQQTRRFVLFGYRMAPLAEQLIDRGYHAVVVGTPDADTDPTVPCVHADHERGGYLAAQHLLELGHRRLAFAFDMHMHTPYAEHSRGRGHELALAEIRQKTGETVTNTLIDANMMAAWRNDASLAAAYFRHEDAPTGIAVWNDSAAIILLGILHRAGLRVPDDISVIGFDALPEGIDTIPPLTTIDQHVDWQMQTVLRLLTRPTPPPIQAVIALPELKRRASCGPPPPNPKGHL